MKRLKLKIKVKIKFDFVIVELRPLWFSQHLHTWMWSKSNVKNENQGG